MSDEEKVVEETTEATETKEKAAGGKAKGKKPDVDVKAIAASSKDIFKKITSSLKNFFGASPSRSKLVLTIMFALQALLTAISGAPFLLVFLQFLIAGVGFIGLSAVITKGEDEEEAEEKTE